MLAHPDLLPAVRAWHPDPQAAVLAAEARVRRVLVEWGLTVVRPLGGGSMSVVVLAETRVGDRVVVKAPVRPEYAAPECAALGVLPGCPRVLGAGGGVLVLEYVDGVPAAGSDGGALARVLLRLHAGPVGAPPGLPSWSQRQDGLLGEYVARIGSRGAGHPLRDLAVRAGPLAAELAAYGPVTVCHGDLQGKNVLLAAGGPRPLDPAGVAAPAGWDVALAAASVTAHGGDAGPVLAAARALRVADVPSWLAVCAAAIGGGSGFVDCADVSVRLVELVRAHS